MGHRGPSEKGRCGGENEAMKQVAIAAAVLLLAGMARPQTMADLECLAMARAAYPTQPGLIELGAAADRANFYNDCKRIKRTSTTGDPG